MSVDFREIEGRMIERLREGIPYLGTVKTYAGEFEERAEALPIRFPAVYVVYGGSEFERVDGPTHREVARYTVLAAARNLRGDEEARRGGPAGASGETGSYGLVRDVIEALTNETLGLGIERLRPVRVRLVVAEAGMSVYGVEIEAGFDAEYAWP